MKETTTRAILTEESLAYVADVFDDDGDKEAGDHDPDEDEPDEDGTDLDFYRRRRLSDHLIELDPVILHSRPTRNFNAG